MNWEQVCADPALQNLPYKIELNKWGQVVISIEWLKFLVKKGKTFQEFPLETSENVKAPDVY